MARRRAPLPARLEATRQRFESWRSKKEPHSRIPDRLWDQAVKRAGECGIHRTARTLRLDYKGLKKRVEAALSSSSREESAPAFFELVPGPASGTSECLVELEDPRGPKMRIHLKSAGRAELTALAQLFWRREG